MQFSSPLPPLEMWGGVECTINRVGDTYFDQLERNGHVNRLDDLTLFAELGIRKIRYPIQWERIAPSGLETADWSWADQRLERLRTLGITPIVGLTHHGSGPRWTSLVNSSFAEGLAEFAQAVAQRYPWVEYYTPVNEPLTTARFSGLYGHWYPHGCDRRTFARTLLTQLRAVVLSMQAIRQVNPQAKLIQTEDLGKIFSTPLLAQQAEGENERRWLTFDLLCGRLDSTKPMWQFLLSSGCSEVELEWFLEHPCIPDVLGIDYYLTSERFLDEHMDRYPLPFHGGNGRQSYADVEVVRVDTGMQLPVGHAARLRDAWERYKLPVAITEAHLGSTREEQVRWLTEAWKAAQEVRQEGGQVQAVTAWSLLGAYDWNNLVTRVTDFYEPGVFDVRGASPRPTALARVVRKLATGQQLDEPVLDQSGWWRRPERFLYRSSLVEDVSSFLRKEHSPQGRPMLILGETGELGNAFARECDIRALPYQHITNDQLEKLDRHSLRALFLRLHPWAVISTTTAGYGEERENDPHSPIEEADLSFQSLLAQLCAQHECALLTFSSALVFDGRQQGKYVESSPIAPCCSRGEGQAQVEKQVLHHYPSALVVRTGALLPPREGAESVAATSFDTLHIANSDGYPVAALPALTYIPDLVSACLDLLVDGARGLWHLANESAETGEDGIETQVKRAGLELVHPVKEMLQGGRDIPLHSFAPAFVSERGQLLPSLEDALLRYHQERAHVERVSQSA